VNPGSPPPFTTISTSTSDYTATGTTSATLNGYWLLVQNGTVRA
jgi:hypothetical protein